MLARATFRAASAPTLVARRGFQSTRAQFASYNVTAPVEASSAAINRHRLNMRGNRALNHAIHMIAVTQVAHDTPGRAYYLRKQAEGKTRKEALRALKRRISDALYRQLVADALRDGGDQLSSMGARPLSCALLMLVHDRWAVVAYVRALQLSQAATLEQVPPEARERLDKETR